MVEGGSGAGPVGVPLLSLFDTGGDGGQRISERAMQPLKKNAEGNKPFTINRHVRERWGGLE